MYIKFIDLVNELSRRNQVICFNIPANLVIREISVLPYQLRTEEDFDRLSSDTVYICEYRRLISMEMHRKLPPLICVMDPNVSADSRYFAGRSAAVVTESTIQDTLLSLMQSMYTYGRKSSVILDASKQMMKCSSLKELMETGFELLGNPLVLENPEQRIVAATPPERIADPDYREVLAEETLPVGSIHSAEDAESQDVQEILLADSKGKERIHVLYRALFHAGKVIGYLQMMAYNRDIEDEDYYIMELLSDQAAGYLLEDIGQRPSELFFKDDSRGMVLHYMRDVLDDLAGDLLQRQKRAQKLPVRFRSCFYVMTIRMSREMSFTPFYISELSKSISETYIDSYTFLYKNSILTVFNTDKEILDFSEFLEPLLHKKSTQGLVIGISNVFSSPALLKEYTLQAQKAIVIGNQYYPGRRYYLYSDYILYYLTDLCLQADDLQNLVTPEMQRLIVYCEKNDFELMKTLKVYLDCSRNRAETAKKMYLHPNTVKYRLEKIEEITHVDLKNDDVLFRMKLSLLFLECQKKKERGGQP